MASISIARSTLIRCLARYPSAQVQCVRRGHVAVKPHWEEEVRTSDQRYPTVFTVKPAWMYNYFKNELKIRCVQELEDSDEGDNQKAGVELIQNIAHNYDYWIVRSHQPMILYYRLEMMVQRVNYLSSVGLDTRQKLRHIQKYPPALVFSFDSVDYDANLVYLRGLSKANDEDFIHLFHPVCDKTTSTKKTTEERMEVVQDALHIKQFATIRELLNMPCFFLDPFALRNLNHLFIHKYSMPFHFDLDKHTADVLPPICNLPSLGLSATEHFSNKARQLTLQKLPIYQMSDILNYEYANHNGVGTPECLASFLRRAEYEESKDRTGGQQIKGIRGFNVPKRQY